jgi:hypothetical protein
MSTKRSSVRGGDDVHLAVRSRGSRPPRHRAAAASRLAVWSVWFRPVLLRIPGKPAMTRIRVVSGRSPRRPRPTPATAGPVPGWRPSRGRPCRQRIGTGSSPACRRCEGDPDGTTSSTPRGNLRRRPDDGAAGAAEPTGRGGRHHHLGPRTSWCSYHQVILTLPAHHRFVRWEVGAVQERRPTLRGNSRRRPDDGDDGSGVTGRTRWASSPARAEDLLVLIPPGDPHTSDRPPACPVGGRGRTRTKIHTARRLAASAR